jgi:PadR family transcriptional regulator AphA
MNTPIESKSQERRLTTTSYGVLAVLALRDHSTYELTKQMRYSLHYLWPRAESNVYAEPKRLVAAGLAEAREEWRGERRRTVYSITETGREALREWIASPSARQRYESEAVLKVFFGENGSREDMIESLRAVRQDALAAVAHWQRIADVYEAGEGSYPARFALSALVARLLGEQQAVTARWSAWAEEMVSGWDDVSVVGVDWGIATIRATGKPFPLSSDPIAARETPDGLPARALGDATDVAVPARRQRGLGRQHAPELKQDE